MTTELSTERDLVIRERAVQRLKKRRDFHAHLLVYVLLNGLFVLIWVLTGADGFFWPVFLIGFWGVGLVMNAYDVYRGADFSEEQIEREVARMRG